MTVHVLAYGPTDNEPLVLHEPSILVGVNLKILGASRIWFTQELLHKPPSMFTISDCALDPEDDCIHFVTLDMPPRRAVWRLIECDEETNCVLGVWPD